MGPRQIFSVSRDPPPPCGVRGRGRPPPHHAASGGGAVLLLTFCGSKAGAAFRLAMISIGSGVKPRASQRCRNNCLTVEMEYGAPANFLGEPRPPPPCGVRGRGRPPPTMRRPGAGGAVLLLTFCGSKAGAAFRLAMISIGSGVKPRASQRCRNNCLTVEMEYGAPANFLGEPRPPPPPCGVRGRGRGRPSAHLLWFKGRRSLSSCNDFNWQRRETARIATLSQQLSDG